ncbi:hypothetical protein AFLA_000478 [Aspergillus flavus NRRL3357]|nr:hypothetical protein AFLA_000478 [Aspergillus flavus NRRL3357]
MRGSRIFSPGLVKKRRRSNGTGSAGRMPPGSAANYTVAYGAELSWVFEYWITGGKPCQHINVSIHASQSSISRKKRFEKNKARTF